LTRRSSDGKAKKEQRKCAPAGTFRTIKLKNKSGHVFTVEQVKAFALKSYPEAIFIETYEQFTGKAV
jgi:hypothetical protein